MRLIGTYKRFKLYEISDKDIAASGGMAESRYIRNSVLVFVPEDEQPVIGKEVYIADSNIQAKGYINTFIVENNRKLNNRHYNNLDSIER